MQTEMMKTKTILVNVAEGKEGEKVLEELEQLADTAGYEVVATLIQRRERPDKAYYIGAGKLEELKQLVETTQAELVIFDNNVNGSQFHNLEKFLGIDVIDRSTLILEIFAQHATSNEGKLQVELAQKKNILPRSMGDAIMLSRQGGGGGGGGGARRGAGEQKIEIDRRIFKKDIFDLEAKIDKLTKERALRRAKRQKSNLKVVSIVGYTNAGKSTLMNTMTKANVLEKDMLFATLDPVSRKLWLDTDKEFLLVDTVGFISRLPHEFIKAFRSTLEETQYADLILHVVDASSKDMLMQFDVVNEVLASIGVKDTPIIVVMNKADKGEIAAFPNVSDIVVVSAKLGTGIEELKQRISNILFGESTAQQ